MAKHSIAAAGQYLRLQPLTLLTVPVTRQLRLCLRHARVDGLQLRLLLGDLR